MTGEFRGTVGLDEPKAGMWLITAGWRIEAREIAAVTPKLFKLKGPWARQVRRDSEDVIAVVDGKEVAEKLRDSIAGIYGECKRRVDAAQADYRKRADVAKEARDKAVRQALERALGGS